MVSDETLFLNIGSRRVARYLTGAQHKQLVIFCHGYRGSSIGPSRLFVKAAQELAKKNIGSLRFDQYGSGNSPGDFYDSSFNDWATAISKLADYYHGLEYEVVILGQSMGASAAIVAASKLNYLKGLVAWVPDPSVEDFEPPKEEYIEEAGQRVKASFWQEAHDAAIAECLSSVSCPAIVVQCSQDQYVSSENHQALIQHAQP